MKSIRYGADAPTSFNPGDTVRLGIEGLDERRQTVTAR
jgi:hypothetical protein